MTIDLAVFDVNGTLLDDSDIFFNAINGIFKQYGHNKLPIDELKERFGNPWTRVYREEGITEDTASDEELYEVYNRLYRNQPDPEPSKDIEDVLEYLESQGVEMAIVSTQQNEMTVPLLEQYDLKKFFSAIKGGTDDKTAALRTVCQELDIAPDNTVYIGDQTKDILHAKNAGVASIAYTGGIHSRKDLKAAGPDYLLDRFEELPDLPLF